MSTRDYLEACRSKIDQTLDKVFPVSDVAPRLTEAIRYSLLSGGKRVRPALAFAACEAVGGAADLALSAACAVEMIHTYSLIHDDLPAMDDDDLRRGQPTNHKVYGEAMAILAGDALLTEAFHLLSVPHSSISAENRLAMIQIVSEGSGMHGMVGGQVLDIANEGATFTESQLQIIHVHKTGKLLRASVLAGARAGNASPNDFECLDRFGRAIGLAFQIADDVLDVTGTAEELGKNAGRDSENKKATYPALLGVETSRQRATDLLTQALDAVEPLGPPAQPLISLARYIVERKS